MDKKIPPFPATVDLQSASWSLYGPEANNVITSGNNRTVAGLAVQRLDFSDHVYDFPRMLKLYEGKIK
ncbi:MAG: hypothetical protein WBF88_11430 [Pusillimonas sp.]